MSRKILCTILQNKKTIKNKLYRAWPMSMASEEALLEECRILLLNVSLQVNILDEWKWLPFKEIGILLHVTGFYQMLTSQETHIFDSALDGVWQGHSGKIGGHVQILKMDPYKKTRFFKQ